MRASQVALLAVILIGCIRLQPRPHTLAASAPPAVCNKLARQVLGYNLAAVAAGVINGGATLTTTLWDQHLARDLFGGGSILFGGIGASFGYVATFYAAKYHSECN